MKPTSKASGLAFRQARLEGPGVAGSVGTDDPRFAASAARTYGTGAAGTGTANPTSKVTAAGGSGQNGPSFGRAKTKSVVGPKYGPGPGGIGRSGRGAPIT